MAHARESEAFCGCGCTGFVCVCVCCYHNMIMHGIEIPECTTSLAHYAQHTH